MIRRKDNWCTLLDSFIKKRMDSPFKYGFNDCCLYVCDALLKMTETDFAKDFRGKYRTKIGAARFLKKHDGVLGIADKSFKKCNIKRVAPNFAGRGDPVLFQDAGEDLLGIISTCGRNIVSVAPLGGVFLPRSIVTIAWRIP